MIFKVLYQELRDEIPVRERTKAFYVEADTIREVRKKINDRHVNIEYIHALNEAHLSYEKQSESFAVENV
ncbi:DNA-dependent RNA polymerase subunit epsilon [Virgibacillus oceani]